MSDAASPRANKLSMDTYYLLLSVYHTTILALILLYNFRRCQLSAKWQCNTFKIFFFLARLNRDQQQTAVKLSQLLWNAHEKETVTF